MEERVSAARASFGYGSALRRRCMADVLFAF